MARPEITGRRAAFSISEFCRAHGISRAHYYLLRAKGETPDELRAGNRVLITLEAEARWRKRFTVRARRQDAAPLPDPLN